MKKPGYYLSGEFVRMAQMTLRTIRYYDKQNILKPSYVTDAGARFYTDENHEYAILRNQQQIDIKITSLITKLYVFVGVFITLLLEIPSR